VEVRRRQTQAPAASLRASSLVAATAPAERVSDAALVCSWRRPCDGRSGADGAALHWPV
jgi:hypothetical protein